MGKLLRYQLNEDARAADRRIHRGWRSGIKLQIGDETADDWQVVVEIRRIVTEVSATINRSEYAVARGDHKHARGRQHDPVDAYTVQGRASDGSPRLAGIHGFVNTDTFKEESGAVEQIARTGVNDGWIPGSSVTAPIDREGI